jgi:hypothetical protein
MNDGHVRLLRELCKLAGIDDVQRVLDTRSVAHDGVVFSLMPEKTAFGEMVVIYCEYGAIPASLEAAAHRRLLEINLVLAREFLPIGFCVNPENLHVLLAMRLLVADTTAASLLETLKAVSVQARRWRESYYLESDRQFPTASMLRPGPADKRSPLGGRPQ